MNEHDEINGLLAEYAAGSLAPDARRRVDAHLSDCPECREDLALFQLMSEESTYASTSTPAPSAPLAGALRRVHALNRRPSRIHWMVTLLKTQIPLIRQEIWPASAAIMIIGYIAAVIVDKEVVIQALAPLVAAASIAMLFGVDNDPVSELMYSAPTSPRQILLARLALVFTYNFLLAGLASICLLPVVKGMVLSPMVLGWLAPMTFLSALALFLSIYIGSENAAIAAYSLWIFKYILQGLFTFSIEPAWNTVTSVLNAYTLLWQQPLVLFSLSAVLLAGSIWSAGRVEFRGPHLA
jgi:hypothetical protein